MGRNIRRRLDEFLLEPLEPRRMLAVQLLHTLDRAPQALTPVGDDLYFWQDGRSIQRLSSAQVVRPVRPPNEAPWRSWITPRFVIAGGKAFLIHSLSAPPSEEPKRLLYFLDPRTDRGEALLPAGVTLLDEAGVAVLRGVLYFAAQETTGRITLWRSDGTAAGTRRFVDVALPEIILATGKSLYFAAYGQSGQSLFRSDGTEAGTTDLQVNGSNFGMVARTTATAIGENMYFYRTTDMLTDSGIWVTDGTQVGTHRISGDYGPTSFHEWERYTIGRFASVGRRLFFSATTPATGTQVWVVDSVNRAARRLTDFAPESAWGLIDRRFVSLGTELVFSTAMSHESGPLWKIGADDRSVLIESGGVGAFTSVDNRLYFTKYGILHISDGTPQGTRSLGIAAKNLTAGNGKLYFTSGNQVWADDPSRGVVEGYIYNDANENGAHNPGELFLPHFRVYVDANRDGRFNSNEPWGRSDPSGRYRIGGLLPGDYTVRLTEQPTWIPSSPVARTITVRRDRSTWVHFGNMPNRGSIEGVVYNDLNRNGTRDRFETQFLPAGYRVYLDRNNDGLLNTNEPWTRTDAAGKYRFDDLAAGPHTVRLKAAGWEPASTAGHVASVAHGPPTQTDISFKATGTLEGVVFDDLDGNRFWTTNEPLLSGFRVFIDFNQNGRWDALEPFTRSGWGGFRFDEAPAGQLQLGVSTGPNWVITAGVRVFTLDPGRNVARGLILSPI